jgi:hypothetical protein
VGLFLGVSDRVIGWPNPKWERNPSEMEDLYFDYYLPSIVSHAGGTGVALVGLGSYRGYFQIEAGSGDNSVLDGRGRPVEEGPLVNLSPEAKNGNFQRILDRMGELTREKAAGRDICATAAYKSYADSRQ